MTFSETLKDLREEQGITQTLLAAYCKVSTQCISSLEKGTRSPTGTTLLSLANYFNVSVDYLLGRTEDPDAIILRNHNLKTKEQQLIENYRKLPSQTQDYVFGIVQNLALNS